MMQTKKKRRNSPIPLCLLPVYVFVLVRKELDDRKTSPVPDISAKRKLLPGENIVTVLRVPKSDALQITSL
jgi:hypothetical protein